MQPEQIEQENTQNQQVEQAPTDPKKPKINTATAIITAGALIAIAVIFSGKGVPANQKPAPANNQVPPATAPLDSVSVKSTDYVRGDLSQAQVVIVEYSDSDCPFCQRFHSTMQETLKNYGNKVAWVYRFFPLSIHPNANNEALALECVGELGGNDAFWKFLDQVIDITVTPEKSNSVLTSSATALGIDAKLFSSCLSNPATAKKVADQSAEGQSYGAQGTPFSIAINKSGKSTAIPGAYPIEEVAKIIDGLMK